jgi:hypothetical protein
MMKQNIPGNGWEATRSEQVVTGLLTVTSYGLSIRVASPKPYVIFRFPEVIGQMTLELMRLDISRIRTRNSTSLPAVSIQNILVSGSENKKK